MMLRFLSHGYIFFLSFFNHWVFLNKKWKRRTVMESRLGHKMERCGCKQHKFTYPLPPLHLSSPRLNATSASNSALYKYNPSSWLFTAWAGYSLLDLPSLISSLLWSGLVLRAFRRQDLVSSGPFWIWSGQSREDSRQRPGLHRMWSEAVCTGRLPSPSERWQLRPAVLWIHHRRKEVTVSRVFLPLLETMQTPVRRFPALTPETGRRTRAGSAIKEQACGRGKAGNCSFQ